MSASLCLIAWKGADLAAELQPGLWRSPPTDPADAARGPDLFDGQQRRTDMQRMADHRSASSGPASSRAGAPLNSTLACGRVRSR